jgi:hypothetical protein
VIWKRITFFDFKPRGTQRVSQRSQVYFFGQKDKNFEKVVFAKGSVAVRLSEVETFLFIVNVVDNNS